jgi:peptidoglycan/xylan/chitin deacetylase (PgdA/CDA1 family)
LTAQGARRLPHIGFHTVRHDPLTHINDEQLARALADGRAGLAELAGYPIDAIAYPFGDFDSRVVAGARESHFKIGVTCERQSVTPGSDPLALGRYAPAACGSMGEFAFELVRTLLISPS